MRAEGGYFHQSNFKFLTFIHKLLGIILTVISFSLCVPFAKAQQSAISRFAEVVDSLHTNIIFPYTVAQGITLMNIGVDTDNKMLVINYLLNPDMVDAVANNAVTDNGIAQLLTVYDEIFSTSMIDAGAGCKKEQEELRVMLFPIINIKRLTIKINPNLQFFIGHKHNIPAIILTTVTKTQPITAA